MQQPGPSKNFQQPKQHWPTPATPPQGSPNIVLMMLDDVGFADFGCYGSEIDTPSIDQVAARGVRYSGCLLYTSPSPRDGLLSRMPSSA